jgi:hypothetical protein
MAWVFASPALGAETPGIQKVSGGVELIESGKTKSHLIAEEARCSRFQGAGGEGS